jgi:hypothetical protein
LTRFERHRRRLLARWRKLAICAYFGHQPISELRALSHVDLELFYRALLEVVEQVPVVRL